ncbi:unnamed protein product [Moneuplotes crassus]|uniref:C2 NT-type domain-containing protein n=1 Tax=Euplotes crassus TaxID=5936 RepID=A0AAD1UBW8_EUPCR|nr:unnamed protein product [Moneuplotes crassus]
MDRKADNSVDGSQEKSKSLRTTINDNIQLKPISLQINLHLKKIQLSVPSPLTIKLMWVRGSKKLETKKKVIVEPKSSTTIFSETMSLVTKFSPDPANPTKYKRKRCYLQIMAMTKGQIKPVGILPFNLSEFVSIPSQSTMKLSFAKCFDSKAAIFLSTSKQEIETNSDPLETESNATIENFSDTFSECSNAVNFGSNASFPNKTPSTTEDTNLSSYVESESRSPSFISSSVKEDKKTSSEDKPNIDQDKLLIQKLSDEVSHYKAKLAQMTATKQQADQMNQSQAQEIARQKDLLEEKSKHLNCIKLELKNQQEEIEAREIAAHSEHRKLKMKIDYLTNKCFELNCKLDKKEYKEGQKPEKDDSSMVMDLIENKQKEYCDTDKNQLQDPTDFIFNIFSQYESMKKSIRKLSEQNDLLKNELAETKVRWADSAGESERLGIAIKSMQSQMQRLSTHSSQRGSQVSASSQNEEKHDNIRPEINERTFSSYLGGISFWGGN